MKKQPDTLALIRALRRAFRDGLGDAALADAYAALRRRLTPRQGSRLLERYKARWPRPRAVRITLPPTLVQALTPWCEEGETVEAFALRMLAQVAEYGPPRALARLLDEAEQE